jgi:methionyl-tRNA synthetase
MMHSWNNYPLWGPAPFMGLGVIGVFLALLGAALVIVVIALKGYALWYAAKRDEKWWFVVMLIINTAGILELVYLIFIVKKWHHRITKRHEDHN